MKILKTRKRKMELWREKLDKVMVSNTVAEEEMAIAEEGADINTLEEICRTNTIIDREGMANMVVAISRDTQGSIIMEKRAKKVSRKKAKMARALTEAPDITDMKTIEAVVDVVDAVDTTIGMRTIKLLARLLVKSRLRLVRMVLSKTERTEARVDTEI